MSAPIAVAAFPLLLYRVDALDHLIDVGGAWGDFADANAGRELDAETILGRSLWD